MLARLGKIIVVSCLSSLVLFSSIARADDKAAFDCTLTNKTDGSKMDTFTPDTKTIYLLCQSGTVKKGENYKAVWIATDTNNVVPANYKIDEKGVGVDADLGKDQVWNAKFSLSAPEKGWPAGKYRVELYDTKNALLQTFNFNVKA